MLMGVIKYQERKSAFIYSIEVLHTNSRVLHLYES